MTRMLRRSRAGTGYSFLGLLMLALPLTLGVGTVAAQGTQAEPSHPAYIQKGTCTNLDPSAAYQAADVGPRKKDDNKTPSSSDLKGALTAAPVLYAQKSVDVKLDDLLTQSYALDIHESAQNIQNSIACGDIGGYDINDQVVIGLKPVKNSGYGGIALLEKDGDKTKVTIYLTKGLGAATSGQQTPTPSTAPTPATPTT